MIQINAALRLRSSRITDSGGEAELSKLYREFRNPSNWDMRWLDAEYMLATQSENDKKYLCVYEPSTKAHANPNDSASGSFLAALVLTKSRSLSRLTGRATYVPWIYVTPTLRGKKLAEQLYTRALNGTVPMLCSDEDQAEAARALWKKLGKKFAFLNLLRSTQRGTLGMQTLNNVAKDSRILTLMCSPVEFSQEEFMEWAEGEELIS